MVLDETVDIKMKSSTISKIANLFKKWVRNLFDMKIYLE
jgi:CRISPR/Cas system CSM-associated protein Csm2 small subunit